MALERTTAQDSFFDVLERVLDKGIVIDAAVQISVAGIQVLRLDAWVVVASIETYLRHENLMKRIVDTEVKPGLLSALESESSLLPDPASELTREPESGPDAEPGTEPEPDPEPEPEL